MMKREVLWAFSLLMVFGSCAKDMNNDDYKRQQYQRDAAKLAIATGDWTGPLNAISDGRYLGALAVKMTVAPQEVNGQDPSKSTAQPVLMGEFEFHGQERVSPEGKPEGAQKASIKALNAFFDPATGIYKATVVVKHQSRGPAGPSSPDNTIYVIGAISADGVFTGTIEANEGSTGHREYGGRFRLTRNGPTPQELNKATKPDAGVFWGQQNFAGVMQFLLEDRIMHQKAKLNANLVLTRQTKKQTDEDFASIFLPTKQVDGTLNFGDGVHVVFEDLLFDQDTGVLEGERSIDETIETPTGRVRITGTLNLSCARVPTRTGLGFDCSIDNDASKAAHALFAPIKNAVDPVNDSNSKAEVRLYNGSGLFPDGMKVGKKHRRELAFSVAYQARSRREEILDYFLPMKEKLVSVSFTRPDVMGVGVSFASVRYDTERKTLNAMQDILVGGVPARQTIWCQNYQFAVDEKTGPKSYRFQCTYINSLNNIEIPLAFPTKQ